MSLFNLFIFSKKRFNTPNVHFTLAACSTNISEVISKHRKRDILYKNYQNYLNHSRNKSKFSGPANSANSSTEKSGTERLPKNINFTNFAPFSIIPLANLLFRSTNYSQYQVLLPLSQKS